MPARACLFQPLSWLLVPLAVLLSPLLMLALALAPLLELSAELEPAR
jgi:hypothetical protein